MKEALLDYVYEIEDLQNGELNDDHRTRQTLYHYYSLVQEALLCRVLKAESAMLVQRQNLARRADRIHVKVFRKSLLVSEYTLMPLVKIYGDVLAMLKRFLAKKNTLCQTATWSAARSNSKERKANLPLSYERGLNQRIKAFFIR